MKMDKKLRLLAGKEHEELENALGFTHYLETKGFENFKPVKVDHDKLVNAFLDFNKKNAVSAVIFHDGIIHDLPELALDEIENNLRLLKNNRGIFASPDDEDLAVSVGLFTEEYMAEFMQEIIFFSGKKEAVERFSSALSSLSIKHFPPDLIQSLKKSGLVGYNMPKIKFESPLPPAEKPRKLGRNEPCHCGSGIKYKKCCLEADIREAGSPKKVLDAYEISGGGKMEEESEEGSEFWEGGYFAETMGPKDMEQKMSTFHMKHDEEMKYNCKKCDKRISAHNKDWHNGMCDGCFDKAYYKRGQ